MKDEEPSNQEIKDNLLLLVSIAFFAWPVEKLDQLKKTSLQVFYKGQQKRKKYHLLSFFT